MGQPFRFTEPDTSGGDAGSMELSVTHSHDDGGSRVSSSRASSRSGDCSHYGGDGSNPGGAMVHGDDADASDESRARSPHRGKDRMPLWSTLRHAPWSHDPAAWHLLGMSIICLYIVNGIQHMLVTYLCNEAHLTLSIAGIYSSLTFALSLIGKVLWGVALDRPGQRVYALVGTAFLVLGSALLVRPTRRSEDGAFLLGPVQGHGQLLSFACTYGLGYGATFTLVQSRAAQLYGSRADFAVLQSVLATGQYLGSFLGIFITVQLRERLGSFVAPFALMPVLATVNLLLCLRVFRPPRP